MIVRITKHPRLQGIVLVHTPPDLAHDVMGPFQPARWSPQAGAYLLGEEHLETFTRHLGRHDVRLVDERGAAKADDREKFTGPLPECSACGQPASRQAALALSRCPACGAVWRPVVVDAPTTVGWTPKAECPTCGRRQRDGWAFCGGCGTPMPPMAGRGPRPEHVERPKLAEPATLGDVAEQVMAQMAERQPELDLDGDDRDFAKRAAGDQ